MMTTKLTNPTEKKDGPAAAGAAPAKPKWYQRSAVHAWGAATVATGAVITAALLFQQCGSKPAPEPPMPCPPAATCPEGQSCQLPPPPPVTCAQMPSPYMLLCGNGKVDRNVKVVAFRQTPGTNNWTSSVENWSESCNESDPTYCEADCPTRRTPGSGGTGGGGHHDPGSGGSGGSPPVPPTPPTTGCRPEITGQVCGEAMNSLISQTRAVHSATGAASTADVTIRPFTVTVSGGVPRASGTPVNARVAARFGLDVNCTASCPGGTVPGEQQ